MVRLPILPQSRAVLNEKRDLKSQINIQTTSKVFLVWSVVGNSDSLNQLPRSTNRFCAISYNAENLQYHR